MRLLLMLVRREAVQEDAVDVFAAAQAIYAEIGLCATTTAEQHIQRLHSLARPLPLLPSQSSHHERNYR